MQPAGGNPRYGGYQGHSGQIPMNRMGPPPGRGNPRYNAPPVRREPREVRPKVPFNPKFEAARTATRGAELEKLFADRYKNNRMAAKEKMPEPFMLYPMQSTNPRNDHRNRNRNDNKKNRKNADDYYKDRESRDRYR